MNDGQTLTYVYVALNYIGDIQLGPCHNAASSR